MVERWLVPLIPFSSYKLCASDRPGAVKGARFARRSEPLTARTDLESYEGEGKGIPQPSSHLPTKNPEYPKCNSPLAVQGIGLLVQLDGFIVGNLKRFRPGDVDISDEPLFFSPGHPRESLRIVH